MKCEQLSIDRWNRHWNLPTNQIGDRGASSTIGHMDDIRRADKQFEPLAGQMVQAADAGRSIRQFARIAFGVVRKLLQCPNRQRRIDGNRLSDVTEYGNRIEASNRIIRHVNSCDGIDHHDAAVPKQDGVAVGPRTGNSRSSQLAATSADVFDDDRAE